MNKHVVAISVLVLAIGYLADKCSRLERKLAIKSMECECYKFAVKAYTVLLGDGDGKEKKEG